MTIDRSACPADRHGRPVDYSFRGCRCADAREAWRLYRKRLREGRQPSFVVDGTGTARRLQSLVAAGHSQRRIAAELGISEARVHQLARRHHRAVARTTEAAVMDLFRRLDGTPGTSAYARTCAKRHGWVDAAAFDNIDDPLEQPKLGDPKDDIVDEVAITRALAGDRIRLTRTEVFGAVAMGRANSLSAAQIGDRLRFTARTVQRIAARIAA